MLISGRMQNDESKIYQPPLLDVFCKAPRMFRNVE